MLNIIKADIYRIFKGKGVYITFVIFLTLILLQVLSNASANVGVNINSIQKPDEYTTIISDDGSEVYIYGVPEREIITGKIAPFVMAETSDNLIYFMLPFIVFIAAADFSNGTVKNLLWGGVPRIRYFLSKLILTAAVCLILSVINIAVPIITATIMNGFGGNFNLQFITDVLEVYLPQTYLLFAFSCAGVFIIFAAKKTAILNTIYIALSVVPILLVLILSEFNDWFLKLMDYDIVSNMKMFAYPDGTIPPDLNRAVLIGAVFIAVSVIGGILAFRKSEIK